MKKSKGTTAVEVQVEEVKVAKGANKKAPAKKEPKVIELPKEEVKEEVVEALPVTILAGTWKDGMEAKSFENSVLQILKLKFNCEVSQIKNTNKNEFEVTGLPEDVELLTIAFTELVTKVRIATKAAYKESDKTFSLFRFTTNYHKVLLETMDMEVE